MPEENVNHKVSLIPIGEWVYQAKQASVRETWLDLVIKTGGSFLALIRRNKTLFSLLTQPFAQAYIAGHQTYSTQERFKILSAILASIGGFFYGSGLGVIYTLSSIPKAIYNGVFASVKRQEKTDHVLAISSSPGNKPGVRVQAIMEIRDCLLQLMATAHEHSPSTDQLIQVLLIHMNKVNPSLLSRGESQEVHYKNILANTFPLEPAEWQQLFAPVIDAKNHKTLQKLISQYVLQIDTVFIYALYECLSAPNYQQNPDEVMSTVVDKHKLKDPQDEALSAFVHYYAKNTKAKKRDIPQYSFFGTTLTKLKVKEQSLRKIQMWMNNALDRQWVLDVLFTSFMDQYTVQLNPLTLADIIAAFPNSLKEVLFELLSKPGQEQQVLKHYQLDGAQKGFLLQCAHCYATIKESR